MNDLNQRIRALRDEAFGVIDVDIYRPEGMAELLASAICGDVLSANLARLIRAASEPPPPECLACGRKISAKKVGAVAIILPHVPSPRNGLAGAICTTCARGADEAIYEKLAGWLKATVWPDLREIPRINLSRGGHA